MKELTIEEKAKAYDEAIKRARNTIEVNQTIPEIVEWVESLFPELKESEDERIKEAIIATIHLYYGEHLEDEAKEMLAWLEKQGEKKNRKASYTAIAETGNSGINALITRDIEIPFGAKDSELQEATYYIPKGYHVKIEGNKVVYEQKSQRIISAEAKEAMYDKPVWSEEDEEMCQETIDWFEKKCFPYALESENPARESIKWLKSLKQRIGG